MRLMMLGVAVASAWFVVINVVASSLVWVLTPASSVASRVSGRRAGQRALRVADAAIGSEWARCGRPGVAGLPAARAAAGERTDRVVARIGRDAGRCRRDGQPARGVGSLACRGGDDRGVAERSTVQRQPAR